MPRNEQQQLPAEALRPDWRPPVWMAPYVTALRDTRGLSPQTWINLGPENVRQELRDYAVSVRGQVKLLYELQKRGLLNGQD